MTTARPADAPPAGAFYVTGGTLPADAPSYVPRQADHDLLDGLTRGEFCYVLNTRQMGKSSLMVRTARALRQRGDTVAVLDLTAVGLNLTPEQWYDGLLASLAAQLRLEDALEDFWLEHPRLGPLQRFMAAVREIALPRVPQRLILFVDEIDAVRSLPFPADEFFAAVRECYNRRAEDPEYARLTFCLLGVATPADLIQDTKLSPFNIGRRIALTDFAPAEAAPLARRLPGGQAQLTRVLYWTGGHPYMTQRLCRAAAEEGVSSPAGVDALCVRLFLTKQARETDDNLAFVRNRLLRSEADLASLLDLYTQVRAGRKVKDDETNPLCGVLRLSGVVAVRDGLLRVRNRVYDRVFDKDWVTAHMPGAELRRQRAAYRRGLLRAAAIASVVLLLMGLLSAEALHQGAQARAAARRADSNARAAQHEREQAQQAARRAEDLARRLGVALTKQSQATRRAHREALAARLSDQQARYQTRLARTNAAAAQRQKARAQASEGVAVAEKGQAVAQAALARRKTQEAQASERNARDTERLADLQLAWQTYDSDTGAPAVVQSLLDASRPGDGRERFEWRYQWSQIHDGPQMHAPGASAAAVTPGGYLVALDRSYRLHRVPIAGGPGATVALPDPGTVAAAALSPDGTRVAVGRLDGRVEVRDAATLRPTASWEADGAPLMALAFEGGVPGVVQGVFTDGGAARWDPATGRELAYWTAAQNVMVNCSFLTLSPDGRYRAAISPDDSRAILLTDTAREGKSGYLPSILFSRDVNFVTVCFSPDGRTVATGDSAGGVKLWDTATATLQRHWFASTGFLTILQFSPDGGRLATAGWDGVVRVWAVPGDLPPAPDGSPEMAVSQAPKSVATYKAHLYHVTLLDYSTDGRWLVTGDDNGTVRAWRQGVPDQRLAPSHSERPMNSLVFPPEGKWLVGADSDGQTAAWDTGSGRPHPLPSYLRAQEKPRSQEHIFQIAFSPDGRAAAASGLDFVWSSPEAKAGGEAPVRAFSFVQLWDRATGKAGLRWERPINQKKDLDQQLLTALAFSPDGSTLAGGFGFRGAFDPAGRQPVRIWDVAKGRTVRVLTGFGDATCALAFSPDGRTLAVGSHDHTVTCFDTRTWAATRRLYQKDAVVCLAYSPDGRWLATGDNFGTVTVTDTRTWRTRSTVGFPATVYALCYSPDSRTLASCGLSAAVDLWDVSSLRAMRSVPLEADAFALAFSPDGTALAVATGNSALFLRAAPPARIAAWDRQEHRRPDVAQLPASPLVWTDLAAAFGGKAAGRAQAAAPLTLAGYNQDVIADGPYDPATPAIRLAGVRRSTTATLDGFNVFYAPGFNPGTPALGLPAGGRFVSHDDPTVLFGLRPARGANALLLSNRDPRSATGTLALAHPGRFRRLALLMTAFNGAQRVQCRLNFADGSSAREEMTVPDNFAPAPNDALVGFGRVGAVEQGSDTAGFGDAEPTNPKLFDMQVKLSDADARRLLTSVTLTEEPSPAGGKNQNVAVFAIIGARNPFTGAETRKRPRHGR